jgi:hypothetical protein
MTPPPNKSVTPAAAVGADGAVAVAVAVAVAERIVAR